MQTQQMKEACLACETSLPHGRMFIEWLHFALCQCELQLLD